MSKNIKIELELPEFEKELNITVTLRKDGEAITTSPTITKVENPIWKQKESSKKNNSNMMNEEF